jgi:hypothetical protein
MLMNAAALADLTISTRTAPDGIPQIMFTVKKGQHRSKRAIAATITAYLARTQKLLPHLAKLPVAPSPGANHGTMIDGGSDYCVYGDDGELVCFGGGGGGVPCAWPVAPSSSDRPAASAAPLCACALATLASALAATYCAALAVTLTLAATRRRRSPSAPARWCRPPCSRSARSRFRSSPAAARRWRWHQCWCARPPPRLAHCWQRLPHHAGWSTWPRWAPSGGRLAE